MRLISVVLLLMLVESSVGSESMTVVLNESGFENALAGKDVIFCARDLDSGQEWRFRPSRGDERHRPFSTFKIPNLVIALETGVALSLDDQRPWRREERPPSDYWPEAWKQDQTLVSAFRRSAVWYFR
ncbi:MAG: penicillin-binding transpeptidase domain-containing protein, partial [Wenzhouxiangella sp.]|nr:penicillin-binding transpeptidase domain-containing protein [Wenzhouxiangella sp.]